MKILYAWYVSNPSYFGMWFFYKDVAKKAQEYLENENDCKFYLEYLPVPHKEKKLVNMEMINFR